MAAKQSEIMARAHEALNEGRYEEAERLFQEGLELGPEPAAVNNLAVLRLDYRGDAPGALELLRTNLENPEMRLQPYSRALAARCFVRLGRPKEARRYLRRAVSDFEAPEIWRLLPPEERAGWQEYATMILHAVGESGDHRQVWTLYQRWARHHVHSTNHFYGGVAAFNLKRYRSAAAAWRRGAAEAGYLGPFVDFALWCDAGSIPPFELDYELPRLDEVPAGGGGAPAGPGAGFGDAEDGGEEAGLAWIQGVLARPSNRVLFMHPGLEAAFVAGRDGRLEEDMRMNLQLLVAAGGPWGVELADALLMSREVGLHAKMAAGHGLLRTGRVGVETPLRMWWDGEIRDVLFQKKRIDIVEGEPEWYERLREAMVLRREGRAEEATRRFSELAFHEDGMWPPAVYEYATDLALAGDYDEARKLLEMCHQLLEPTSRMLVLLIQVCMEQQDLPAARRYLEELEEVAREEGLSDEHLESITFLRYAATLDESDDESKKGLFMDLAVRIAGRWERERREAVEEKPMPPSTTTLRRGLGKIPVQWLEAASQLHGLDESEGRLRRPEREAWLEQTILASPAEALAAVAEIDDDGGARRLLQALLEAGGALEADDVTERFGSDSDDGFFWEERWPESPLGRLRAAGLVFVGQANVAGRRVRVAVVPTDLRAALERALAGG